MIIGVLADRPASRELWRQGCHAFANALKPSRGQSLLVPLVKLPNDLLLQQGIEALDFMRVPGSILTMFISVADSPPNLRGVRLRHQPSSSEIFSPPFVRTFIPLVPQASHGRRGVLIQTSTPCTKCSVNNMS